MDPVWRGFLDRMSRIEADLPALCANDRKGDATGDDDLEATLTGDYRFVQAGDQLSLIFCNAWTAPFPRPGGRTILKGTTLEVVPDLFDNARVPLRVRARRVAGRAFTSAADLRAAFEARRRS